MTNEVTPIYSRNKKLNTEMTMDNLQLASFKNEKEKKKAISLFEKADKNGDGHLDADEIKNYDRKQILKTVGKVTACTIAAAIGATVVGFAGFVIARNKRLSRGVMNNTADIFKESNAILDNPKNRFLHGSLRSGKVAGKPDCTYHRISDGTKVSEWVQEGRNTVKEIVFREDGTKSTEILMDNETFNRLKAILYEADGSTVKKAETWRQWLS